MEQKRITGLILSPSLEDGTSWYRCEGPFADLERNHPELTTIRTHIAGWPDVLRASFVFMHRPVGPEAVDAARMISRMGKPIWVDYDDNLLAVPEYNPAWHPDQQVLISTVEEIVKLSTVVTVSTDTLKEALSPIVHHTNFWVVPNGLDADYYDTLRPPVIPEDRPLTVMWRGSPTHREALEYYSPAILGLAAEFPDTHWVFQGYRPWQLFAEIPEDHIRFIPWSGIPECFFSQYEVAPDIMFAALLPNGFDMCRSQIAAMEATAAGAIAVVPAWLQEWTLGTYCYRPGVIEDFKASLKAAMKTPYSCRQTQVGVVRDLLKKQHLLSDINQNRWKIIERLAGMKGPMITVNKERDLRGKD